MLPPIAILACCETFQQSNTRRLQGVAVGDKLPKIVDITYAGQRFARPAPRSCGCCCCCCCCCWRASSSSGQSWRRSADEMVGLLSGLRLNSACRRDNSEHRPKLQTSNNLYTLRLCLGGARCEKKHRKNPSA